MYIYIYIKIEKSICYISQPEKYLSHEKYEVKDKTETYISENV